MENEYTTPAQTRIGHVHLKVSDLDRALEFYRDRPRDEWEYAEDGSVKMETLPLDVNNLLKELE